MDFKRHRSRVHTWVSTTLAFLNLPFTTSSASAHQGQARLPWPHQPNALPPLKFGPSGTFHLSIFEDLHFGENAWEDWGPRQDVQSVKVINSILDSEPNIDLAVLNGDLITGDNSFHENSTVYIDKIVQPLVHHGLTWASTYGNHDNHANISGSHILARERRWPGTRTQQTFPDELDVGVSNYYLPVYGPDCSATNLPFDPLNHKHHGCTPALLLWFFDSRGGFRYQPTPDPTKLTPLPNWVDPLVADWFIHINTLFTRHSPNNKPIPSLAFVHIPPYPALTLQEQRASQSDPNWEAHHHPGINDDVPVATQAQGWCANGTAGDGCVYGGQDKPFWNAISTTPGVKALFFGHDHGNTWCAPWKGENAGTSPGQGEGQEKKTQKNNGINLCFGQHSGYGGYGNWIRGARQVVVSLGGAGEDVEVETYMRLESGDVVGAVSLNGTYGGDWYPATPNDQTKAPETR
ncbi:Metallo-dependent phosphatase-like protein [Chaetomium sp. MPI-SDFR-AT-0129]|nr:Metallo-dependent phosphatase-like protein [Chaetomium sp. MPI-SDFR-AT-0129]